jgi:hypothetical protein
VQRRTVSCRKSHGASSRCAVGFPFPNLPDNRQKQLFRFFVSAAQGLTP